jgi:peptidoglycan/xylan/chitin deacetylase (PgdA/CDA1 family)
MPPAKPPLLTAAHAAIAAATLALCCLALMLWQVRSNMLLREEIRNLRDQRMGLIENIRETNREVADLRDSLSGRADRAFAPQRRPSRPGSAAEAEATPAVSSLGLPISFDNGPRDRMLVALTFDGGSLANAADEILDTLASRNVRATMFVSGEFVRRFPRNILRIASAGHEFGNHTATHPHLTSWESDQTHTTLPAVNAAMIAGELRSANIAFRKLTGRDFLPLWRAPYGEKNRRICLWAQNAGYLHIGWRQGRSWRENLDSNDWIPNEESSGYHAPREVLDKILSIAASGSDGINGGIVLLHLGTVRRDPGGQVHRMLGVMIDRLRGMGYRFVTVSEMLAQSGVSLTVLDSLRLTQAEGRIAAQ